jgi:transposase
MASIIKKKVKKKYTYYYRVESARINGKPRIINQKYLGNVDDITRAVESNNGEIPDPSFSIVQQFGAVAALFDLSMRLNIIELINKYMPKRNQGLSIGEYIVLAAINRAVEPESKNEFYSWFDKTVLHKYFPLANKKSLSSQGFWENMSLIEPEDIPKFEDEFTKIIVEKYSLSTDCLIYDATNFFTYLDTANPSKLGKRGNSKEKRKDLKIIGLSLMVSPDNNIPLFHETYPGNSNDSKQFAAIINSLQDRYFKINGKNGNTTLVFDKGNNSEANIENFLKDNNGCQFHVVGSLKLNQCQELLKIDKKYYKSLSAKSLKDSTAFRTKKVVYGREMTIIIVYNPELIKEQLESINNTIVKCTSELNELRNSLLLRDQGIIKKGKKPTEESVKKRILSILSVDYMKQIFSYDISCESKSKKIMIDFYVDQTKFEELKETFLGKTILFSDNHDWDTEKIISSYRSQYHVEECFKQMKNTKYLSLRPILHWTDQKIKVHAFYCVLSLTLCSLLNKEINMMGYNMSINRMLKELSEVEHVITVFPMKKKKKDKEKYSLSGYNDVKKNIIDKLDLKKYCCCVIHS